MCTSTSGKVSDLKRMFEQGAPQSAPKGPAAGPKLGYSKSVIVKPGGNAYGEQLRARFQRKSKSPERPNAADDSPELPIARPSPPDVTTSDSPSQPLNQPSQALQEEHKPIAISLGDEKASEIETNTHSANDKSENVSLLASTAETNANGVCTDEQQTKNGSSDQPAVQDTREPSQPVQTAASKVPQTGALSVSTEPSERSERSEPKLKESMTEINEKASGKFKGSRLFRKPTEPRAGRSIAAAAMLKAAATKKLQRARSAIEIKAHVLKFCVVNTQEYGNIKIDNFSTSFSDGLAFCALIHHFYPDAFDYSSLDSCNAARNMQLAFDTAQTRGGIAPLLDVDDMINYYPPDWKCVFTYVQLIYQKLLNHPLNKFKNCM